MGIEKPKPVASDVDALAEMQTTPHSKEEEIDVDSKTMNSFSSALATMADNSGDDTTLLKTN